MPPSQLALMSLCMQAGETGALPPITGAQVNVNTGQALPQVNLAAALPQGRRLQQALVRPPSRRAVLLVARSSLCICSCKVFSSL